jgi:hypothetical protein
MLLRVLRPGNLAYKLLFSLMCKNYHVKLYYGHVSLWGRMALMIHNKQHFATKSYKPLKKASRGYFAVRPHKLSINYGMPCYSYDIPKFIDN